MKWISVSDKLPELGKRVIIHCSNGQDLISSLVESEFGWIWNYVTNNDMVVAWAEYKPYEYEWHF